MPGVIGRSTVARNSAAWSFASPTTGTIINSTTAVTLVAAPADLTQRNYLTDIHFTTATLGAPTEFAIRDGAAGTVLWRILLQTTALGPQWIGFQEPLMGTKGNLLEVVTLTAVTGAIYINAQGYISQP